MTVLVTAASKHGSTREIARAISAELAKHGIDSEYKDVGEIASTEPYDAFVIGSAIYMGKWQDEARGFLSRNQETLESSPVWLFSSGPVGDNENVGLSQQELSALRELSGLREHRMFAGKLDRDQLGFGERLVTRVVRAPDGDYRDWDEIRAWAASIAGELNESPGQAAV